MTSKGFEKPSTGQGFEQPSSGYSDLSHLATGDNAPFAGQSESGANTITPKTQATGGAVGSASEATADTGSYNQVHEVPAIFESPQVDVDHTHKGA